MTICNTSCLQGKCTCGRIHSDGSWKHLPLMLKDGSSPAERKPFAMMTDSEIRSMRDSVRTMTVSEAARLPIYDNVRGGLMSGRPAEQHCALLDGAQPDPLADQHHRSEAYRDHMIDRQYKASLHPVNDNAEGSITHARDGRPLADLSAAERAREQMISRLDNSHKR